MRSPTIWDVQMSPNPKLWVSVTSWGSVTNDLLVKRDDRIFIGQLYPFRLCHSSETTVAFNLPQLQFFRRNGKGANCGLTLSAHFKATEPATWFSFRTSHCRKTVRSAPYLELKSLLVELPKPLLMSSKATCNGTLGIEAFIEAPILVWLRSILQSNHSQPYLVIVFQKIPCKSFSQALCAASQNGDFWGHCRVQKEQFWLWKKKPGQICKENKSRSYWQGLWAIEVSKLQVKKH